jgi:hypothetical protein
VVSPHSLVALQVSSVSYLFNFQVRFLPLIFQSFQKHLGEIADVSLTLETFPFCKYPSPLENLRNRTQEADGSIPFISTIFIRFFRSDSVSGTG